MLLSILNGLLAFAGGVLPWSFTEYALHNWWGHVMKGKNDFSREHLAHHANKDYFTPIGKKLKTAVPAVSLVLIASVLLFGLVLGLCFAIGFGLTYTGYEVLHYRLHVTPPRGFYSRWARMHHFAHHFNCPKHNHGVTSPIWDIVFGTYRKPDQVRVPHKMAMQWLCDDQGEVKAPLAADYTIRRKRRLSAA